MRPLELAHLALSWASAHPITALLSAALLLWACAAYRGKFFPYLRGPLELPIVGALLWLLQHRHDVLGALLATSRAYGFKTWTVKWLGEPRYVMTAEPRNLEHILKTRFDNYPKGVNFSSTLADLLGSGIFASDGGVWKQQRHLFATLFSENSFKTTVTAAFHKNGAALERALLAAAAARAPLDVFALLNRFTLDTIGEIAFGVCIHSLEHPAHPFAAAFDEAQQTLDLRFFTPGWRWLRPFLPSERRLVSSIAVMDSFCAQLIASRRAEGEGALAARTDVLSRAMCLESPQGGARVFADSPSALRDLVLNFLIAGRDTTAQALSWAILSLCSAATPREVEAQLAQEAARVRAASSAGGGAFAPTYQALEQDMPFARAVMLETLRLYPSVPKDVKSAVAHDVLPDGTAISPGTTVAYLPYVMGRSPALWGEDACTFSPARFVGQGAPSPWKLPAFNGAGPRACLGQRMALAESNFVLGLIFSRFSRACACERVLCDAVVCAVFALAFFVVPATA